MKTIELVWSYIPTVEVRKNNANQLDWNYTIFALINEAYSDYKKTGGNKVDKTLIIPCKVMGLFYMLDYFDYENMTLMGGTYNIEITHEDVDYIECKSINTVIKINKLYEKWDYIE